MLLKNTAGDGNHWVGLKLQGTSCNRDADRRDHHLVVRRRGPQPLQGERRQLPVLARHARGARARRRGEGQLGRDQMAAAERPGRALHRRARSIATSPSSKAKAALTPEAHGAPAGRHTFAGLFATTLATLTYQLLLTRIFSVTMYYHFAFVAISVTMFGMAVGALIVYRRPHVFTAARVHAPSGARGARFRADDRRQLPGAHLAALPSRAVAVLAWPASSSPTRCCRCRSPSAASWWRWR